MKKYQKQNVIRDDDDGTTSKSTTITFVVVDDIIVNDNNNKKLAKQILIAIQLILKFLSIKFESWLFYLHNYNHRHHYDDGRHQNQPINKKQAKTMAINNNNNGHCWKKQFKSLSSIIWIILFYFQFIIIILSPYFQLINPVLAVTKKFPITTINDNDDGGCGDNVLGLKLNTFIPNFEPLYYDRHRLLHQYTRLKRNIQERKQKDDDRIMIMAMNDDDVITTTTTTTTTNKTNPSTTTTTTTSVPVIINSSVDISNNFKISNQQQQQQQRDLTTTTMTTSTTTTTTTTLMNLTTIAFIRYNCPLPLLDNFDFVVDDDDDDDGHDGHHDGHHVDHIDDEKYQHEHEHNNHHIRLEFSAHNRKFQLLLKSQSETVFAQDVIIESTDKNHIDYDMTNVITGYLEDDEDSKFVGIITKNGLLDGHLQTRYDEYYIEPAERYFDLNFGQHDFHSVIYVTSDVYFPFNATHGAALSMSNYHPNHPNHHNFFDETTFFVRYLPLFNPFHQATNNLIKTAGNWFSLSSSFQQNDFDSDDHLKTIQQKRRKRRSTNNSKSSKMLMSSLSSKMNGQNISNNIINSSSIDSIIDDVDDVNDEQQIKTTTTTTTTKKMISSTVRNYDDNDDDDENQSKQQQQQQKPRQMKQQQQQSKNNGNNNHGIYWRDMDSLHYTESEPYGIKAVHPRTHWIDDQRHHDRHVVVDPKKTTCMLYLQADHLFYEKMGSEEACIESMTRHVQKVNNIYKNTDFDQDGRPDNISFLIKRIKVHTMEALKDPEYRYPSTYGVEKFLELFSEEDYDAFCLAYMFTYRDFEGGTLGLAWTGDLKNAGGVCEKNGHYRGSLKSLNTGIVTLLNYGKHVPPIVSHVTLAHEIGHNFGSPHDPEDDHACTPGGENGNYIMFARATSGDKRNNNKFSPCSLRSINAVLNTKAKSLKGCFQEPQDAICGNEVVEDGEECDCGWEEDCKEPCCFPMRANPPPDEPPCRLRPNVICSPSQGPCCTQDCKLKVGNKCRDDNGCRTASYCNGQGPQCPPSTNKANKTICNEEYVCYMGECTGSICMAYGLESCQCKQGPNDSPAKLCELCCRMPSDDSTCKSSFEWNTSPYDVPDLYAKPGTPCDNYNGYCDVNQRCREVDPSSPLATLRRLLLSNESMASLKRWFNEQWFYVAVLILITVLILLMAYKVFNSRRSLRLTKTDIMEVALEAVAKHQQEQQQAAAAAAAQQQQQQQQQNNTSESSIGTNSTTITTTPSTAIHLQSSTKSTNSTTNTVTTNTGSSTITNNITNAINDCLSSTKTITTTTTTTTTTSATTTSINNNTSPSFNQNSQTNNIVQQRNSIDSSSQSSSLIMTDSYNHHHHHHGKNYCPTPAIASESTYSSQQQQQQTNLYSHDSIKSSSSSSTTTTTATNNKSNYQFESSTTTNKHGHNHHNQQHQTNLYGTKTSNTNNNSNLSKTPSHALYFPSTNGKQQQHSALYHHPFSANNNNTAAINSIYGYTTGINHHHNHNHHNQYNNHHHHSIPSLYHPSATIYGYPQSLIPSQQQQSSTTTSHQSYYDTAAGLAIVGHHNHPQNSYGTATVATGYEQTTYGRNNYYGYHTGNLRNYPTSSAISYYQPSTIYDYLPFTNQTISSSGSISQQQQQQIGATTTTTTNKPPPLPSMATHPSLLGATTTGTTTNMMKNSQSSSSSSSTPSSLTNTNSIDPFATTTRRLYSSTKDNSLTNIYGSNTSNTVKSNTNLHHFYYYPSSLSNNNNYGGGGTASSLSNKFLQHHGTVHRNKNNGSSNRHYQHYFPSTSSSILHNHNVSNNNNNNNSLTLHHHFHPIAHQQSSLSSTPTTTSTTTTITTRQHHSSHPQLLDTQAFSLPTTITETLNTTRSNQQITATGNLLTTESIYHSTSGHNHIHHSASASVSGASSSFRRHTADFYEPLPSTINHYDYSSSSAVVGGGSQHDSDYHYSSSANIVAPTSSLLSTNNFHQQTTFVNDSLIMQQQQQQQQQRLHHSNSFHGHLDDLDHLLLYDQTLNNNHYQQPFPQHNHHFHHHHNHHSNTIRSSRSNGDSHVMSTTTTTTTTTTTITATNSISQNRSRELTDANMDQQINKIESNNNNNNQQQQQHHQTSTTNKQQQQQQHSKHPGSNGWV